MNLKAIRHIMPQAELHAIEINLKAVEELEKWGELKKVYPISILDFDAYLTVEERKRAKNESHQSVTSVNDGWWKGCLS